ncbi:MAG: PaaI family thioesterase [Candidatus Hodarchaeales archaeon]|jgi:hypothetical protein
MSNKISSKWKLPQNDFYNCYGCSQKNIQGLKLRFWYTNDGCLSYYTIPRDFCGFNGIAHGGVIATILDEIAAWTIITHLFRFGITLQSLIKYLKPVRTDVEIIVEGKIINNNSTHVNILSTISSTKDIVLAKAESKWLIPINSTIAKIMGIDENTVQRELSQFIGPIQEFLKKKE